tara:strand:+ start:359 stop:550 length:192 start_codon:yes stop_codon:yes gene_type:complete
MTKKSKFKAFKSFKNDRKAQKYLDTIQEGQSETLVIRTRTTTKDDGNKFQVGTWSRIGNNKKR